MIKNNTGIHLVVVNTRIQKEDKFLVTKRSTKEIYKPGYRSIVGGKVEEIIGVDCLEGNVKREVKEEVGVEIQDIKIIGTRMEHILLKELGTAIYITYISQWKSGEAQPLDGTEEVKRVTLEEIKNWKEKNLFDLWLPYVATI